jgi:pimeloyl-ACP methyl ester carboxylesterase
MSDESVELAQTPAGIGGSVREHYWTWKGKSLTLTYEVLGEGKPILLVPSLSTVSSRTEMKGLAEQLARQYQVFAIDWVGFGDSSRLAMDYTPDFMEACLRIFASSVFAEPVVVVAAGHAAGYVMKLAHRSPCPWKWVVLVCPTWRGPLPSVLGDHRWAYRILRFLMKVPFLGDGLYSLMTHPKLLKRTFRRRVFANEHNVTRSLMQEKWELSQQKGARFASSAFVTGGLDRVKTSDDWFNWFQPLPVPVLMVIGENMPRRSRQEMEILAHFTSVQVQRMPGSLGLHEEYPEQLAAGIMPFLDKYLSRKKD